MLWGMLQLVRPVSEGRPGQAEAYPTRDSPRLRDYHWIAAALFIMLDGNVASAFRKHHRVEFANTTQCGYTAENYFSCLKHAQAEIEAYGYERFRRLEPATPLARLFDKAAWVVGKTEV